MSIRQKLYPSTWPAYRFLVNRAGAYKTLFRRRERSRFVSGAYRILFGGPVAETVLRDLASFCRARQSTYDPDPRVHAALEGRREVWLRIEQHLNLSPEELWRIVNPTTPLTLGE